MGAPDRTMLPERCLVLITEPLLSNPAVSVCAYFSMLVSILRMAREEFERGEIQYLAVLSPGIQCSGWIESSKLAVDALKPFLHEAEVCEHMIIAKLGKVTAFCFLLLFPEYGTLLHCNLSTEASQGVLTSGEG